MAGLYGRLRGYRVRRPLSVSRARTAVRSKARTALRYALRRKLRRKRGRALVQRFVGPYRAARTPSQSLARILRRKR